jgi:hypothetical protein
MTTKYQAEDILLNRLQDNLPSVPANNFNVPVGQLTFSDVEWPNQSFNQKKNSVFLSGLSVTYAESVNAAASFGGLIRTDGIFVILVRQPKLTGADITASICDELEVAFRKQRIGPSNDVCLENIQIDTLGMVDSWYTRQVNIFFYIEDR